MQRIASCNLENKENWNKMSTSANNLKPQNFASQFKNDAALQQINILPSISSPTPTGKISLVNIINFANSQGLYVPYIPIQAAFQ